MYSPRTHGRERCGRRTHTPAPRLAPAGRTRDAQVCEHRPAPTTAGRALGAAHLHAEPVPPCRKGARWAPGHGAGPGPTQRALLEEAAPSRHVPSRCQPQLKHQLRPPAGGSRALATHAGSARCQPQVTVVAMAQGQLTTAEPWPRGWSLAPLRLGLMGHPPAARPRAGRSGQSTIARVTTQHRRGHGGEAGPGKAMWSSALEPRIPATGQPGTPRSSPQVLRHQP